MVIKHNTLFLGRARNIQTATDVILSLLHLGIILNYDFLQTNQASPATLTWNCEGVTLTHFLVYLPDTTHASSER